MNPFSSLQGPPARSLPDILSAILAWVEQMGSAQPWRNLMAEYGPIDKTDPTNYRMPIIAPPNTSIPPWRGADPKSLQRRQLFPEKGKIGPIRAPSPGVARGERPY